MSLDPGQVCGSCKFSDGKAGPIRCRRFPPQVGFQQQAHWFTEHWPEVKLDDWCGEWQQWKAPSGSTGGQEK